MLKDLRPEFIRDLPATPSKECDVTAPIDIDVSQDDVLEEEEFEDVNGESIKHRLASLFLHMQQILHVSKSATQEIDESLYDIGTLAGECTKKSIENVLREHNCNYEGPLLALFTEVIQETNPLGFLSRSGPFRIDHKRLHFFKDNFPVIEPDISDYSVRQAIKSKYKDVPSVSLTSSAFLHGTVYINGMFVSLGTTSGLPDFAKILKVLTDADKASFIIERFLAWYLEHLRCYELIKKPSADLVVAEPEELNSYCPLSPYHLQGRLLVSPRVFLLY